MEVWAWWGSDPSPLLASSSPREVGTLPTPLRAGIPRPLAPGRAELPKPPLPGLFRYSSARGNRQFFRETSHLDPPRQCEVSVSQEISFFMEMGATSVLISAHSRDFALLRSGGASVAPSLANPPRCHLGVLPQAATAARTLLTATCGTGAAGKGDRCEEHDRS